MTANSQNGSARQGGAAGPASHIPGQQPQSQASQAFAQGQQPQRTQRVQPMPQQGSMPAYPTDAGQQSAPSAHPANAANPVNGVQGHMPASAPRPVAGAAPQRPATPQGNAPQGGGPRQPNGGGTGQGSANDNRKRNIIIGAGVAVVVVIVIVCAFFFVGGGANGAFYDPDAKEGQASYKTLEEIEAERNRQMEEGMLNISIASVIEFENSSSPGTAYIENVPSNKYVLKVTITTDSNGETVYQSGGIKPDSVIESIKLSQPLGAGTYPATATFVAYDPDTLNEVGQAAAKVTLVVDN